MCDNLLYFPLINVPKSSWLNRSLLYWDTVSSIVPYKFVKNPEKLSPHMRSLVRADLVRQVIPGNYVGNIPNYTSAFLEHLEQLGTAVEGRRKRFTRHAGVNIHLEKMSHDIRQDLVNRKLGRAKDGTWFQVEKDTANEYMTYLAATIGQCSENDLMPMTDDKQNFSVFLSGRQSIESELEPLRHALLEEAFPAPTAPLNAEDILNFKRKHQDDLPRLRSWVEQKVTAIADMRDAALREKQLFEVKRELTQETNRIRSNMTQHGWLDIIAGDFCALLGPLPFVGRVASIVHAAYNALGKKPGTTDSPLAYAAYAQQDLELA